MATFYVPENYDGMTLREIARAKGGYTPRLDIIAQQSGINENAKLSAGQPISVPSDPGSGEWQWVSGTFSGAPVTRSESDLANSVIDAAQQEIDAETSFLEKYTEDNPFVFDEVAARESAMAEYEPYYKQLLDEYVQGAELQKESIQGERQLLSDLYNIDQGERSRNAAYAIEQAQRGYAGQGLFFSGLEKRAEGRLGIQAGAEGDRARLGYESGVEGLGREERALSLDESIKRRELRQSQEGAVESGVLQRREEAYKPYYYTFESAYKRRFPTGTQSINSYLPADYLRY